MRSFLFPVALLSTLISHAQVVQVLPSVMDSLDEVRIHYIADFKHFAIREMARSGIPASITLAQAILETSAGNSLLAKQANNHFGLKCDARWNGDVIYKHDDEFTTDSLPMLSCFRVYEEPGESFRAHSDFLLEPWKFNRYQRLFEVPVTDYASWARMLQYTGYSGAAHYAVRLIEYIERYRLYELDAFARQTPLDQRILRINGVKCVVPLPGETLRILADKFAVPVDQLFQFNDKGYAPDSLLPPGSRVFLQRKPDAWGGVRTHHTLAENQTLFQVAQNYGITLDALLRKNGLKPGQIPAEDASIRLNGQRAKGEGVPVRNPGELVVEMLSDEAFITPVEPRDLPPISMENARLLEEALRTPFFIAHKPPQTDSSAQKVVNRLSPAVYHTVTTGETLYSIARKYGIPTEKLREINDLPDNILKIGQVLQVSAK